MARHSLFDDDIAHSDPAKYGIQVSELSERETPGQWLPPSLTFDIRHSQIKREDSPQLITKHWLANGRHVDLPDGHRTLANLTGRSIAEAFRDLDRWHSRWPREPSQRTPSLVSDSSHSDSPGTSSPRNFIKDPSLSPKLASFQSNKYPEAALAPVHSMEIVSTRKPYEKDNIGALALQPSSSPDVFQEDVTKCVESSATFCASEISMLHSEAPPIQDPFQSSEFTFSRRAVQKQGASTTQPPLRQPPCVAQPCAEEYDLKDSDKKIAGDAYLPEPKPARGLGIRKKLSKSSSPKFGCPQCSQRFTRNYDMKRHTESVHVTQTPEMIKALTCTYCGEYLSRKDAFKRHVEKIPNSCNRVAKIKQKPVPAPLSKETYAIHKTRMMEACTR